VNEVERRVRTKFEKILERDHGVSREEDKELIDGLWSNLDPEDKRFAGSDLGTGVQDLVLEARESRLYRYYMGYKRGKVTPKSAETTAQVEKGPSSTTREIDKLEDELLGGEEKPINKLQATTRARVAALSKYLSRIAAADQAVVRFRARVLGDPAKTLSPEEATKLIHSLAAQQQTGAPRDAQTLWWSGNDDAAQAAPITVWPGSELWHLRNISGSSQGAIRGPRSKPATSFLRARRSKLLLSGGGSQRLPPAWLLTGTVALP
jgi:hypothetical protein